jgi:hypothetical protein
MPEADRFAVVGTVPLVADAGVVGEVEAGVRHGLAQAGALRSGQDYPRVVVEMLRLDSASEGIARFAPDLPLARGTRIGVVARAWVERGPDGGRERDTGDMQASEVLASEEDARLNALRFSDGTRAAARRLGERLARNIMGQPEPSLDGL